MYIKHFPNILFLLIWRQSLVVLEARADVAELLVDAEALLLLVVAVAHVADEDRQPAHPRERHPPPQALLGNGEPPDLRAAARDLAAEQRPRGAEPRPPEWIGPRRRRPPARVFDSVAFGVFDLSRRWLAGLGRFFAGFSKVSFLLLCLLLFCIY